MTLKIRIERNEIGPVVDTIKSKIQYPKDMLKEVGDIITEDIKHRIVKLKADPQDNKWAPWKPSTANARRRKGNAALGLLYDTGNLLRSITSEVKNHGLKGGWSLYVGTNVHYAEYLNNGTEKMAARPFLGISKRAQDGINDAINTYLISNIGTNKGIGK